jgi:hypothetical protein
MAMARASIRKAAAAGLLFGGTLGLAAPAAAGVTVQGTRALFASGTAGSPPAYVGPAAFLETPFSPSGPWGLMSASVNASGFQVSAITLAPEGASYGFGMAVAVQFGVTQETVLSVDLSRFATGFSDDFVLRVVEWDLATNQEVDGPPVWSLPASAVNGIYTKTLGTLQAGRAYQFGYSESWFTDEDFASVSGGITVTFTEVPAPGALAGLGAAGLIGSRRRR